LRKEDMMREEFFGNLSIRKKGEGEGLDSVGQGLPPKDN
jgi:hypothetical protein